MQCKIIDKYIFVLEIITLHTGKTEADWRNFWFSLFFFLTNIFWPKEKKNSDYNGTFWLLNNNECVI